MCQGLNSHYFHIIGDKLINPIIGFYIPIIRIPIKDGMTIPNRATFDHGTYSCSLQPSCSAYIMLMQDMSDMWAKQLIMEKKVFIRDFHNVH